MLARPWLVRAVAAAAGAAVGATLWGVPPADLAQLLVLLPAVYLVAVAAGRPARAWPAVVILSVVFFAAPSIGVEPGVAVGCAALALMAAGLSSSYDRRQLVLQAAGASLFVALALVALLVPSWDAALVLSAAWAGHAAWDTLHVRRPGVISTPYAIWCGALDLVIAAGLLLTGLT